MQPDVKIKELRKLIFSKGLSGRKLSEVSGIGLVTISQILNGSRKPTAPTAHKLLSALECDFDDLFAWESEETPIEKR